MKIIIQEYQEKWPADFLTIKENIHRALSGFDASIEHIGSTSVPGLGAKPIIDILVGIEDDTLLNQIVSPMQEAGFTYFKKLEPGWPERRLFVFLEPITNHTAPIIIDINDDDSFREYFINKSNIHIVVKDTYDWKRHLAFRDFIRSNNDIRDEYYKLKKVLSNREFKDTLEYNSFKNDFIKEIEKRSIAWHDQNATKKQ